MGGPKVSKGVPEPDSFRRDNVVVGGGGPQSCGRGHSRGGDGLIRKVNRGTAAE